MREALIVSAVRTPIGNFDGALKPFTAVQLGTAVIQEALKRARADAKDVHQVIFAMARQAGAGPNPARQMTIKAGLPFEVPAYTINMACASSLQAVALAARAVQAGEADVVVAGGVESMTHVPYLIKRWSMTGKKVGSVQVLDGMHQDGFFCPLAEQLMGRTAETVAQKYEILREDQDRLAMESHVKAITAQTTGRFRQELMPLSVEDKKGIRIVDQDEHPRSDTSMEKLAKLSPVFLEGGTVTAGNASAMTDGASAVVIASREWVKGRAAPLARVEAWVSVGVDPKLMGLGPIPAVKKLHSVMNRGVDAYDLIEANEAFAAQYLAVESELKLPRDRTNVNGGAIALGHPIACTGARLVTTLVHEMVKRQSRLGLVTLCVSGGLGMALSLTRD